MLNLEDSEDYIEVDEENIVALDDIIFSLSIHLRPEDLEE